ncbi:PAS domain S-box protein [Anabaena sp. UHCC 0204]|uniref:PAS domain S-box protein n=1 Tax=Anabaena sp. UHCC 0204 TaxID=2590009 RepID=UPI0014464E25|nr:PAS domain S-box protein [Anabaena sp. UHCC 0204]MTJ07773.1 PAS domain S-box protein [Anabaena sp. UHCC 0204]
MANILSLIASQSRKSSTTILIVDNSETDRAAYSSYLQSDLINNYDILEAETLKAGLELWQSQHLDVVLIDCNLPDGNGLELLEAMGKDCPEAKLPVIILTDQEDEKIAVCAIKKGAIDYLVKQNITQFSLSHSIHNLLNFTTLNQKIAQLQKQENLIAGMALNIQQSLNLEDIYQGIVESVLTFLQVDRTVIYKFNSDMSAEIVGQAVIPPWSPCLHTQIVDICFPENMSEEYKQGKIFVASDIYAANLTKCHLQLLESWQVRANLVVPILLPQTNFHSTNDKSAINAPSLWGLLIVHQCSVPRVWENTEISLMQQLSVQLAIAIQQAELQKNLNILNASLQQKVEERTQEIQIHEHKFRAIFDNTFQFTGLLTTTGILREANQTALNFGGIKLEDIVNQPFWEADWWSISPVTQENLKQAIASAAQGEFIRYEVDVLGAGSNIATIDFSLRPLKNESEEVIMLIAEGRDITDKKRIEREHQETLKALKASEAELRGLFNAMVDVILVIDRQGRYLKIAPTNADILYRPIEDSLGKTVHEVLPTHLADKFVRIIGQTLTTQKPSECEYSLQIRNQKIWFHAQVSPLSPETVIWTARDITEAKRNAIIYEQVKQAFQESQERYAALAASVPVGIYRTNTVGNCWYVNDRWCEETGLTFQEAVGKGWKKALHPEDRHMVESQWQHLVQTGETLSLEYRFVRPDGMVTWVFGQAIPEKSLEKKVTGYVGTITNITDRKQAVEALHRSEKLYRTLVDNFPNGAVVLFDHDLRYLLVGGLGLANAGLAKAEMEGKTIWEIYPPAVCETIAPSYQQALAGESVTTEILYGDRLYLDHHIPIRNDLGEVIGGMSMSQDITERKQSEVALRDSEEKFRQFAENSRQVMLIRQIDTGELLYVNPTYEEIWGQTTESLYQDPDSWMAVLHPDDRQRIDAAYKNTGRQGFLNEEYRIIRPDEAIRWIWGRCFPIRDTSGEIYRIGAIAEDITERKQAGYERDQLLLVLEAQNQTLETQVEQRTAELQQSKERFRNLVETCSDWIWEVNESGAYTYASPQIINVLGYSPTEILGKTPFDFMPPAEAERVLPEFMQFLSVQAPFQCLENTNRHKDGRLIILETSAVPIFDEDRKFCGYRGIDRDITIRKLSEAALRQNEARFQRIAANLPGVMYQYILRADGSYEFIYISDRCQEVYELESATILNNADAVFQLAHPEDLPSLQESILHSALSLQQWLWEGRIITSSGQIKWIQGISQPERQANGDILWDGLILDISEQQAALHERQQIEIALHKLSDRLNLAIKSAQIGIWDWDIINNHLVWDDRMYELYGVKPSDFTGAYQAWEAGLHPDDLISGRIAIQQAIAGERDFEPEFRVVWPNGTIKFIKAYALVQRDSQGKALRMIGINFDITDRKQSETKLQAAEIQLRNVSTRLKLAVRSAKIGIWDLDLVNDALLWDDRMYQLFGISRETLNLSEEALAKFETLLHPDDRVTIRQAVKQAIAEEKELDIEFRIVLPNSKIRILKGYGLVQRNSQGQPQRMIGINYDISDRKQAEAEIIRSRDLREAIFNESADALFLVDAETVRTIDCNQRAVEMFAVTNKTDLIGIEGHQLQKQQFTIEELQAIKDDMEQQGFWSREIEYKTFTGKIFWGNLAAKQITVAGQKMNLVRVTDISDRKQAETQLHDTNKQLARATRLKDEFLASMSHELRTPLNAILGITEGLQDQVFGVINEKQRQGLQTIERSGTHLLELINDILDLSKIEAGQMELDCTPVVIRQLCKSSLSFIKHQAFQKRIHLDIKIQPNLPELLVDERRMRQVLINLLNNAVKFTPEGGSITLSVLREQHSPETKITHFCDFIRIAIIDTGIGIAPENLHKLFQPFVQIDSSLNRQYTGTGLGLSLVKRIVEMHGGQVGVSSTIGVGSCFMVDLPSANISGNWTESVNPDASELVAMTPGKLLKSPLILLAEDNEVNILTVSSYLEAKGYRIVLAKNGQEAIALTKSHLPDLILMDIQMPGMNGLEAMEQIRFIPNLANLPIIALTALAMPGDREKCLTAGANDYLTKPLKLKHLANTIQRLLEEIIDN